ncbi:MAG TPA: endonuclease/exonuclease/phosphatase family protein [Lacunisphaera sp.]|jgi:endonuclease/exonuclease/phosphatase family metal-dependent hydrolase|nr:endonuclease/exonuclease/phosphatase family protein [Lacunisphaera sp.]HQY05914.1 endonuclease/exonuclease/phosphatase family protein [Lacunisphaera sp.]
MARLRLLSFNVAHARGTLPVHQSLRSATKIRSNLLRIAALIKKLKADIVAVQEIDENSRWNGSYNHLTFLSEQCGLPFTAIGLTNERGGRYPLNYGNGVLSRWPVKHAETMTFGRRQLGDKGFLFVEMELAAGRHLPLINLHLHHASRRQRLLQAGILMKFITERTAARGPHWVAPPMMCGDFNNPPHQPDATATLLGFCEETNNYTLLPKTGRTFPAALPALALDFVLLPEECRPVHSEVVRCYLSDHRPVLVEFELDQPVA